mmetsp:Transcript_51407/g.55650  ORF Transcript_51407/g.55650 Transcript_51407/m.55650 type:complete len:361 (-) Transcript_51407:271-1353(-)
MAFPIYFFIGTAIMGWLTLWFTDLSCENSEEYFDPDYDCEWNEAEALMVRSCSFFLSYLAFITFALVWTNTENAPFLKRLAFHLQYGLMAIVGCSIARSPTNASSNQYVAGDDDTYILDQDEEEWFSVADKLWCFVCFFLLFAYTSRMNKSPSVMRQKPHEGHGITSRTFLVLFCLFGMLPLVKRVPLPLIVPEGVDITDRAKFFYSMSQCLGLALLLLLFVPVHFGQLKDQRITTLVIVGNNCTFGVMMFGGKAWGEWIRPEVRYRLIVAPILVCILAGIALSYEDLAELAGKIEEKVEDKFDSIKEKRKERKERRKNKKKGGSNGSLEDDDDNAVSATSSSQQQREEALLPVDNSELV